VLRDNEFLHRLLLARCPFEIYSGTLLHATLAPRFELQTASLQVLRLQVSAASWGTWSGIDVAKILDMCRSYVASSGTLKPYWLPAAVLAGCDVGVLAADESACGWWR
jgi:hypothetical protein